MKILEQNLDLLCVTWHISSTLLCDGKTGPWKGMRRMSSVADSLAKVLGDTCKPSIVLRHMSSSVKQRRLEEMSFEIISNPQIL